MKVTDAAVLVVTVAASRVPMLRVSVKPGGSVPVHSIPLADIAAAVAKSVPHAVAVRVQPDEAGKVSVMAVIAYWFEAGFVIVTAKVLPGVPQVLSQKSCPVGVTVGATAFWAAKTLVVRGTRNKNPERNRSVSIVPELNLLTYAFDSVFKLYFRTMEPVELI